MVTYNGRQYSLTLYSYGLAVINRRPDHQEVNYLQGDEAYELADEVDNAATPEQIDRILDPYDYN